MFALVGQYGLLSERNELMKELQTYIQSIICSALICSVVYEVAKNTYAKEQIRAICGIFITLMILQPFAQIKMLSAEKWTAVFSEDAETAAFMGSDMVDEVLRASIKREVESYIIGKAEQWNAQIAAEVVLDRENIPVRAMLRGEISPQGKQNLAQVMETDLGITKENQQWTG